MEVFSLHNDVFPENTYKIMNQPLQFPKNNYTGKYTCLFFNAFDTTLKVF